MPQTKNDKRRKAIAMLERDIYWLNAHVEIVPHSPITHSRIVAINAKRAEIERIQANIAKTPETKR